MDQKENLLCLLFQPKRQKKEKKEVSKDKKQDVKEVAVDHEEPASPLKTAEEAGKPQGSYALADMDKTTFDEVRREACFFSFYVFIRSGGSRTHDVQTRLISSEGFSEGGGGWGDFQLCISHGVTKSGHFFPCTHVKKNGS